MTRRVLVSAAVLAALQAVLFMTWSGTDRPPPGDLVHELEPGTPPAPALLAQRADGRTATLSEFTGCPVLLHFWASWCGPCRDELPGILGLQAPGLAVLAVAVDDTWPAMAQLVDIHHARIARALDPGTAAAFGARELPMTLLVDSYGRIIRRYRGPRDWARANIISHLPEPFQNARACAQ